MAIVPKKKRSQSKKRMRHGARERVNLVRLANNLNIMTCKNCGAKKLGHRVCLICGRYGDKQIITVKAKKSKQTVVDAD